MPLTAYNKQLYPCKSMTKEALLAVIDISINKHRALRDNTSALRKIRNSRLMSSFAAEENVLQQHHV